MSQEAKDNAQKRQEFIGTLLAEEDSHNTAKDIANFHTTDEQRKKDNRTRQRRNAGKNFW